MSATSGIPLSRDETYLMIERAVGGIGQRRIVHSWPGDVQSAY